ncbi:carboxymethylenebutenolidase [Frankia sp. AiPs1]|uniref:dienelactone hydrolase family protein n=1 Tax=Frankia sp. AiPa1 TaxID=573492 RepID=UPI00202AE069|nr:dienelactone hydrolase family protein [Frankia sp. AiPa1]MCL9762111.1 dienelactone hydrolase family protein [Frankia sp. AiPa1]
MNLVGLNRLAWDLEHRRAELREDLAEALLDYPLTNRERRAVLARDAAWLLAGGMNPVALRNLMVSLGVPHSAMYALPTPEEATMWVTFPSGGDEIRGYLAVPATSDGPPPRVVIMAHENLGVTQHRQDVTERIAAAGYACLTVDLYSRIGGRPPQDYTTPEERRAKAFLAAADEQAIPDLEAGLDYLAGRGDVDASRAVAIGFCLGGGLVLSWATRTDRLSGVVALYGLPELPPAYSPTGRTRSRIETAHTVRCAVQAHFGGSDEVIPLDQVKRLTEALGESGQDAEVLVYEGAGHAYHDDTHPSHHREAAELTWQRSLDFLAAHL